MVTFEDMNPFSTTLPQPALLPSPPHNNSVMFPSLASAIDTVLEDKLLQVELDSLGCAILPASEYTLSIGSECNFHYSFWDAYNQTQFCIPIDLYLHVHSSCSYLYESFPLALPPVSQIAVRFSTMTLQTRFSRLVPRPIRPISLSHRLDNYNMYAVPTKQAYTITYHGTTLNSPTKKSAKEKTTQVAIADGIQLSPSWERIINVEPSLPDDQTPSSTCASASISDVGSLLNAHVKGTNQKEERQIQKSEKELEEKNKKHKRGFTLRALVPVPRSLFDAKETCTFRFEARVWVEDPFAHCPPDHGLYNGFGLSSRPAKFRYGVKWDRGYFDDEGVPPNPSAVGERMFEASANVTVSHLQSAREMV